MRGTHIAWLRSGAGIGYAAEPKQLSEVWMAYTAGGKTSSNLWTDAYYLRAFAQAARATLVTFDAKIPISDNVSVLTLRPYPETLAP
jgi:hypothetical protein